MAVVTVVERWGTSLHNVGKRTGLNMNGSSIKKNKKKEQAHIQADAAIKTDETAGTP